MKMKHYLAVSFLVVFLYIYNASAAATSSKCATNNMMCDDQCCDGNFFKKTTKTSITVECDNQRSTCTRSNEGNQNITYSVTTAAISQMCDNTTYCDTNNNNKYIYCGEKKWDYCSDYTIQKITDAHCDKGYFWYNNKCNSCAEITGESTATTIKPNAVMLSNCVVGTNTNNTYNDEKGEFTYVAQCYVGCTEETKWYCTSA